MVDETRRSGGGDAEERKRGGRERPCELRQKGEKKNPEIIHFGDKRRRSKRRIRVRGREEA